MPRGPKGEKRPADVIGAAIMVAKIATREIEDKTSPVPNRERGPYKKAAAKISKLRHYPAV